MILKDGFDMKLNRKMMWTVLCEWKECWIDMIWMIWMNWSDLIWIGLVCVRVLLSLLRCDVLIVCEELYETDSLETFVVPFSEW